MQGDPIFLAHRVIFASNIGFFCNQGDSGGPLWVYLGTKVFRKRAFLVGIVSRGEQCAGHNKPGIYTRHAGSQFEFGGRFATEFSF